MSFNGAAGAVAAPRERKVEYEGHVCFECGQRLKRERVKGKCRRFCCVACARRYEGQRLSEEERAQRGGRLLNYFATLSPEKRRADALHASQSRTPEQVREAIRRANSARCAQYRANPEEVRERLRRASQARWDKYRAAKQGALTAQAG
jgi:hypothetical protein